MAETAPRPPFYERNIFWGFLSVAVGAVLAATGLLLPPTEVAKWLLIFGGIVLFTASYIAIRELNSVLTRSLAAVASLALITIGLFFLWSLRVVPSSVKRDLVTAKANTPQPPPETPIQQ